MCDFVSWIEVGKDTYFLQNKDLRGKKFTEYKKMNPLGHQDIMGHGAIRYFYPEIEGKGIEKEVTDLNSPDLVPKVIAKAIKEGKLSKVGYSESLLNEKGIAEYEKVKGPAYAEYEKVRDSAYAEYVKARDSAYAEYKKIGGPAYAEYEKVRDSALAESEKVKGPAFWKIFSNPKYRNKNWL